MTVGEGQKSNWIGYVVRGLLNIFERIKMGDKGNKKKGGLERSVKRRK